MNHISIRLQFVLFTPSVILRRVVVFVADFVVDDLLVLEFIQEGVNCNHVRTLVVYAFLIQKMLLIWYSKKILTLFTRDC